MTNLNIILSIGINLFVVICVYLFAMNKICEMFKINNWLKLSIWLFLVVSSLYQLSTGKLGLMYLLRDIIQ